MRGLIGFAGTMPDRVRAGDSVNLRLWFFHVLPTWRHTIGIEAVGTPPRTIQSREFGGLVRRWDHLIRVSPGPEGRTDYTDEIEIEAGVFTPLVCFWAHVQYRYRQWRWRRLAVRLSKCIEPEHSAVSAARMGLIPRIDSVVSAGRSPTGRRSPSPFSLNACASSLLLAGLSSRSCERACQGSRRRAWGFPSLRASVRPAAGSLASSRLCRIGLPPAQ